MVFSPTGKYLAIALSYKKIIVFDIFTNERKEIDNRRGKLCFSSNEKYLAVSRYDKINIFNIQNNSILQTLKSISL